MKYKKPGRGFKSFSVGFEQGFRVSGAGSRAHVTKGSLREFLVLSLLALGQRGLGVPKSFQNIRVSGSQGSREGEGP